MSSIVEILLLYEQHKQNVKNQVRETILQLKELPPELLERPQNLQALKDYISSNDKYGKFVETNASLFVNDLQPGHRHHDIHNISWLQDDDFNPLIGLPLTKFGNLFESLLPCLKVAVFNWFSFT